MYAGRNSLNDLGEEQIASVRKERPMDVGDGLETITLAIETSRMVSVAAFSIRQVMAGVA